MEILTELIEVKSYRALDWAPADAVCGCVWWPQHPESDISLENSRGRGIRRALTDCGVCGGRGLLPGYIDNCRAPAVAGVRGVVGELMDADGAFPGLLMNIVRNWSRPKILALTLVLLLKMFPESDDTGDKEQGVERE